MTGEELRGLAFRWYDSDTHGLSLHELKIAKAAAEFMTRDPATERLLFNERGAREAVRRLLHRRG